VHYFRLSTKAKAPQLGALLRRKRRDTLAFFFLQRIAGRLHFQRSGAVMRLAARINRWENLAEAEIDERYRECNLGRELVA